MIHLDYRDSRPLYTQIFDGFREQIATGVLRHGEKLPSVRELATELAINPNTIQRAYRHLEVEGWILTVPGKGCFVSGGENFQKKERERWFCKFDESSAALIALGVTKEELTGRIEEGES